jgi:hypothetical protein
MKNITIADLRRLLSYDEKRGLLVWNKRTVDDMPSGRPHEAGRWNKRYAGKPAMTAPTNSGYPSGAIYKRPFLAHIIAWAVYYGCWPENEIDHINGDRSDYRIENLRAVTQLENARNRAMPKNNTSGIMGVSFCKRDKLWVAHIQSKSIGYFKDRDAAIAARNAALLAAGYHENHGRRRV